MQQHLMQMQPMMAAYYSSNNVTTDHIQQYLDENKSLILKIVESQNSGKINECAENQARLQRNLMYLAAIADAQPQPATMHSQQQYAQNQMMQSGAHYMQQQQQQAQSMSPQALMAARSSMLYSQQAYPTLQQSQALHAGQMGMSSAGSSLNMLQGEPHSAASSGMLGYADFGRIKQDIGSSEGRGGTSSDGGEALYLKSGEDGN
ncbi:GRF1-interacting factor 1-like isoform X1 [Chenopodium quinoa]|uniref:GRF1-interacting factor 1-like isoform X1 n=1 Tax=Chenopodium quinoa TaxID=63459 RepID=UPI000B7758CD|nr:GRF1-interacting factor 1-like isoform X1 [Chenopodium quinoa]